MYNYLIYRAIDLLLRFIEIAIIIRAVVSWLPVSRNSQLMNLLYQITEPILAPIRRLIQRSAIGGSVMIDFSPLVAFLLIGLVRNILIRLMLL